MWKQLEMLSYLWEGIEYMPRIQTNEHILLIFEKSNIIILNEIQIEQAHNFVFSTDVFQGDIALLLLLMLYFTPLEMVDILVVHTLICKGYLPLSFPSLKKKLTQSLASFHVSSRSRFAESIDVVSYSVLGWHLETAFPHKNHALFSSLSLPFTHCILLVQPFAVS